MGRSIFLTWLFPILKNLLIRKERVEGAVHAMHVVDESHARIQLVDADFELHAHEAEVQEVVLEPELLDGVSGTGRGSQLLVFVFAVCEILGLQFRTDPVLEVDLTNGFEVTGGAVGVLHVRIVFDPRCRCTIDLHHFDEFTLFLGRLDLLVHDPSEHVIGAFISDDCLEDPLGFFDAALVDDALRLVVLDIRVRSPLRLCERALVCRTVERGGGLVEVSGQLAADASHVPELGLGEVADAASGHDILGVLWAHVVEEDVVEEVPDHAADDLDLFLGIGGNALQSHGGAMNVRQDYEISVDVRSYKNPFAMPSKSTTQCSGFSGS